MRSSRANRVDGNQTRVVHELRKMGVSVLIISSIGDGAPDLVCALDGHTILVELKDPAQPPSKRKLTDAESTFRETWDGILITALYAGEIYSHLEETWLP